MILNDTENRKIFVLIAASFFTFNMLIRSVGAVIYNITYNFSDKAKYNQRIKKKCNQYAKEGEDMRKYLVLILGNNETPGGCTKGGPADSEIIKDGST